MTNNANSRIAIGKPSFASVLPTLTHDFTMNNEQGWQLITGSDLTVVAGVTLTIEPGVTFFG